MAVFVEEPVFLVEVGNPSMSIYIPNSFQSRAWAWGQIYPFWNTQKISMRGLE
jgi:hypothetical protein